MPHLFRLSGRQLERLQPFFPKSRGVSRGDGSKVLGSMIHVLRYGPGRVDDPPATYGPHTTLYSRFRRGRIRVGVFVLIFYLAGIRSSMEMQENRAIVPS